MQGKSTSRDKGSRGLGADRRGVFMIKFALMLPIFLALVFAVLELGLYFIQKQLAVQSVSTTLDAIQKDAGDDVVLKEIAEHSGNDSLLNLIPGAGNQNFICAMSYVTKPDLSADVCHRGQWKTSTPVPYLHSYYVVVRVHARKLFHLPFADFLPDVTVTDAILVTPGAVMAFDNCPSGTPSANCPCPYGWVEYSPLDGRNIIGLGNSGIPGAKTYKSHDKDGEEKHAQTVSEMARHGHIFTHTLETSTEGRSSDCSEEGTRRGWCSPGGDVEFDRGYHDIEMKDAGEGTPMNVMDPYIALKYCIRQRTF